MKMENIAHRAEFKLTTPGIPEIADNHYTTQAPGGVTLSMPTCLSSPLYENSVQANIITFVPLEL